MKNNVAGSLFLWRASALVMGPGIDSRLHAHFALQLSFGIDGPFRARFSSDAPWTETEAALFAPNQQHQIDSGGLLAHLFLELPQPRHMQASSLNAGFVDAPEFSAVRTYLQHACRSGFALGDVESASNAARTWRDCATGGKIADAGTNIDSRIESAIRYMTNPQANPVSGKTLASLVHLSESRFTHLFRAQTGLPLSRYLLWNRLLCALEAVAKGANMTAAAHEAGFADLAHMSRTFRETFGVVPSALQKMTIAFKRDGL
ncbi:MAG TPA: AraC family transcriptional regulator [Burkholderiaceae bacterium]|jgi:AraC-like DNA-binding protein